MLLEVKILKTHLRAEDPRTVRNLTKDQVISVTEKFAREIIKDGDGILAAEEKSVAAAPENKMVKKVEIQNKAMGEQEEKSSEEVKELITKSNKKRDK